MIAVRRGLGQPELSTGPGESWSYPTGLGWVRAGTLSVVETGGTKEPSRTHSSWIRMGIKGNDKEAEGPGTQEGELAGVSVGCQVHGTEASGGGEG